MSWTSENTNFFRYFPNGTPNETACLSLSVRLFDDTFQVDGLWVGLAFLFGFILGVLIVALCARRCVRDCIRKKQYELDEVEAQKMGVSLREYRQIKTSSTERVIIPDKNRKGLGGKYPVYIEAGLVSSKKGKGLKKLQKKSLVDEDIPEEEFSDIHTAITRGLADALVQTNSDGTEAELISQDFDSVVALDKEFQVERREAFLILLSISLNKLKNKEKVDENFCKNFIKKTEEEMRDIINLCVKEKEEDIEELKKNSKLAKDPEALDAEIDKLDLKYNQKQVNLLREHRRTLRGELAKSSGLTETEVDALFQRLKRNMADLEDHLTKERLRCAAALEEKLKRRRQLAQMKELQDKGDNEEFTFRQESLDNVTTDMVQDGKLLEKQRDEILKDHSLNLTNLQDKYSAEAKKNQMALAERLRQKREMRVKKLAVKHEKEKQHFLTMADKETSTDNFIEGFHQLLEQQRFEVEHFEEETDKVEILEFEKLRKDQSKEKQLRLQEEEEKMTESLKNRAQISTRDADRLIKLYHQQTDYYKRQLSQQRQSQQAALMQRLEQKRQRLAEEEDLVEAEQAAFMEQQENTVQKTIQFNFELEESAKERLLEEHRQNMSSLNNQLQMSRMKQQKHLERKLSRRRAKLADWKDKQMEVKQRKTSANQKEKEKMEKEMAKHVEIEEKKLEEEREAAVNELRQNLAVETEILLKDQDAELGILIGRLQLGQARRQAILQKQDKTLQQLQAELERKVTEEVQLPHSETDQIIQQHYNQVSHLNEKVQLTRQRQEQVLLERLQAKKEKKSRNIESTLRDETQEEYYNQRQRGAGLASSILSRTIQEQRHKQQLANLEREMKLEMEREKDELNQQLELELQKELENQRKDFLVQLAAISSISRDDLDEVVQASVAKSADTKVARKVAKDLRQDLQRAKTSLGLDDDDDRSLPDLPGMRRAKSSLGHHNDEGFVADDLYQKPKPTKRNKFLRKPKQAFSDDSHRAYTPPGDDNDDF